MSAAWAKDVDNAAYVLLGLLTRLSRALVDPTTDPADLEGISTAVARTGDAFGALGEARAALLGEEARTA